jgi:hypothetical protein
MNFSQKMTVRNPVISEKIIIFILKSLADGTLPEYLRPLPLGG